MCISASSLPTTFLMWGQALWSESLENHLVGPTCRLFPVRLRAHRPGEQRPAKHVSCHKRHDSRQILDRIGDEMRPRAQRMAKIQDRATTLCGQAGPVAGPVSAFG